MEPLDPGEQRAVLDVCEPREQELALPIDDREALEAELAALPCLAERLEPDRTREDTVRAPARAEGRHRDHDERLMDLSSDQPRADERLVRGHHLTEVGAVGHPYPPGAGAARLHRSGRVDPGDPAREDLTRRGLHALEVRAHERDVRGHDTGRHGYGVERRDTAGEVRVDHGADEDDPCVEIADRAPLVGAVLAPGEQARDGCEHDHGHRGTGDHAPPKQGRGA